MPASPARDLPPARDPDSSVPDARLSPMAESGAERQAREAREEREREAEAARLRQIAADRAKALDEYEAKHANVHSAAIAVLNIKVLVPVVLDRAANNYNRWCSLFLVVLGKYTLTDHVLTDVVNADRPAWVQMDCTVLTWIYGTINADLQQSTMLKNPNARIAWLHLEDEFLASVNRARCCCPPSSAR